MLAHPRPDCADAMLETIRARRWLRKITPIAAPLGNRKRRARDAGCVPTGNRTSARPAAATRRGRAL
eukprot:6035849-Lingulodinium_polyedra.AAC.1